MQRCKVDMKLPGNVCMGQVALLACFGAGTVRGVCIYRDPWEIAIAACRRPMTSWDSYVQNTASISNNFTANLLPEASVSVWDP